VILRGPWVDATHGARAGNLVLDSGGVSALARNRAQLAELRRRGLWPAQVSAVVLTETLTADPRRDVHTNRLLRACQVRDVDQLQARQAARLRNATGRASQISACDAIVAALADSCPDPIILTSDPRDLTALVEHATKKVVVVGV
jgi:hypothetical protein